MLVQADMNGDEMVSFEEFRDIFFEGGWIVQDVSNLFEQSEIKE